MSGLGSLVFDIKANSAQFIAGMQSAERKAHSGAAAISMSLGNVVKATAVVQAATVVAQRAIQSFAATFDAAGQAIDSQQSFGTAPEKFYAMKYAVESAGDSFAEIPGILGKLNTSLGELKAGDGKAKIFETLGLSIDKLKAADPSDALRDIVKALAEIDDPTTRARVGTELLGKGYKDGANALAAFAAAGGNTSGVTLTMLKAMDDLADAQAGLQAEAKNSATIFMGTLAPAILGVASAMTDAGDDSDGLSKKLGDLAAGSLKHTAVGFNTLWLYITGTVRTAEHMASQMGTFMTRGWSAAMQEGKEFQAKMNLIAVQADATNLKILAAGTSADPTVAAREADRTKRQKESDEKAAARIKKLKALLTETGGSGSKQVDKIGDAFARIKDETDRATMSAQEYRLAQFKALGASDAQVAKYTVELDTLEAADRAKKLKEILAGLDSELEAVGKTDDEKAMVGFIERLRQAGATSEESAAALEKFKSKLAAEDAAKFAEELALVNTEISKIGKSAAEAAELDLRNKYKDNPEQLKQMLEANSRRSAKQGAQGVKEIYDALNREAANVGATPLTQYVNELKEAQRLNPQVTASVIAAAAAQKQAILDAALAIQTAQDQVRQFADVGLSALEGMAMGTMTASDGFDQMKEAIKRMLVQALLIAPLKKQIDDLVVSMGQVGTAKGGGFDWGSLLGGSSNGSFIGSLWDGAKSFFGFAMGGSPGPNGMVEVAEGGKPELYRWQNRTFLMTGSQGGTVTPARAAAGGGGGGGTVVYQTNNIDARGADAGVDARISQAMRQAKAETLAAVQSNNDRGGAFANSSGRR